MIELVGTGTYLIDEFTRKKMLIYEISIFFCLISIKIGEKSVKGSGKCEKRKVCNL